MRRAVIILLTAIMALAPMGAFAEPVVHILAAEATEARATDWPKLAVAYAQDVNVRIRDEAYYGNWTEKDIVHYYSVNGQLHVVVAEKDGIYRYAYNSSFGLVEKQRVNTNSYDLFGSFHQGADGNFYVVTGNNNESETDSKNVIDIYQFDSAWKLLNKGSIRGDVVNAFKGICVPFDAGNCQLLQVGGKLYIYTCRLMYLGSDGLRHQSNIGFEVDLTTMQNKVLDSYCSHSFNQFIRSDGNKLYLVDHGDAYPRSIVYSEVSIATGKSLGEAELFKFMGNTGENYTGATINGLEMGTNGQLIVGSSVPHNNAVAGVTGYANTLKRNIFVSVVSNDSSGKLVSSFKWLTNYNPNGNIGAREPRMIKLDDDRFIVLYTVFENSGNTETDKSLDYLLIDGAGNIIKQHSFAGAKFHASSNPIAFGGKLVWLAEDSTVTRSYKDSNTNHNYFFAIDISDPAAPKESAVLGSQDIFSGSGGDDNNNGGNNTGGNNSGGSNNNSGDGWRQESGIWYYYYNGSRFTGWVQDGGVWYLVTPAMAKGWYRVNGVWYYFKPSGAMLTGWLGQGGKWYFLKGSGAMATGWHQVGGTWYYFSGGGAMHTGWLSQGGSWYYMKSSGAMATNWQAIDGKWYWFDGSGRMATGTRSIGGKTYRFNSSGAWIG